MLDKKTQHKQKIKNVSNYLKLISDEQKMKLWIKTLLSVQSTLPEIIKSVDKIIEINASSLSFVTDIYNTEKSTYAQVEKVIDLTERKNKLLNLYLISKNLFLSVNEEDRLYLKRRFLFNWTAEDLASEYKISIRTVFRRIEKLIDSIYEKIKKNNWSINFINLQVKNENWLLEKFYHFAKDTMPSNINFKQDSQITKTFKTNFSSNINNKQNIELEEISCFEKS